MGERFTIPPPAELHSPRKQPTSYAPLVKRSTPAVLFDFDGTVGDTEVPAMEVAFWELAIYLPELAAASDAQLDDACPTFIRENAGKAFEHMIDKCNQQRRGDGLPTAEETRAARAEPPSLLAIIDMRRVALGLEAISAMRRNGTEPATLLIQQKEDTVARLAKVAQPTPGTLQTLQALRSKCVPFVIATTSGKPRVPVCVDAAGMRAFFPSDEKHIHSGESDFNPPKFKPAPDVYIRAAGSVGRLPCECIAVEDSASGVGSASNAGMRKAHAHMLMAGEKAQNKRGAGIVISDMQDLPKIVDEFARIQSAGLGGSTGKPAWLNNLKISDATKPVYRRD